MRNPLKIFWILLGFLCLGLGTIGIVLPILPTVPFLYGNAVLLCKKLGTASYLVYRNKPLQKHLDSFVQKSKNCGAGGVSS